jgi:hypothetical protein
MPDKNRVGPNNGLLGPGPTPEASKVCRILLNILPIYIRPSPKMVMYKPPRTLPLQILQCQVESEHYCI